MMSAPPPPPHLNLNAISYPIVRSAIEAMNGRNKKQWYALFSNNPTFTDDGNPHDFTKWCERELFGSSKAYLASMEKLPRWQWAKPSIEKKMRYVFSLLGQSMFLHRVLLYPFSLENQLAFFHMSRVLLDF